MDASETFERLTSDQPGHFRLHVFAAVLRLLDRLSHGADPLVNFPFLRGYAEEIADAFGAIEPKTLERDIVMWEATRPAGLPMAALTTECGLTMAQRLIVTGVGLVEEDARFMRLFAGLAEDGGRRPTAEAALRLWSADSADPWAQLAPLLAWGLVDVEDRSVPRSAWRLRVPEGVWDVVRGGAIAHDGTRMRLEPRAALLEADALILGPGLAEQLATLPELVRSKRIGAVVLRATPGADAERIAGAIARSLDLGRLGLEAWPSPSDPYWRHAGAVATLTRAMPMLTCDLAPGETRALPPLGRYEGPIIVIAGREGGFSGERIARALDVRIPPLEVEDRRRAWQAGLPEEDGALADEAAERFCLPAGHVHQAAGLALVQARARGATPTLTDVREAMRMLNRQRLDGLADRVETRATWDDLVVAAGTAQRLHEIERRCRHRERLLGRLGPGFRGSANRGVRALLAGASGTGKTLAAKVIAAGLGMDLYRVDLSAVFNKYVGETEKNLHRILATAEDLDVILLLDEGDTLLGARTSDARSANDRYANLETNYLLQRLESYEGILFVTTNLPDAVDHAFRRRMDVVVDFVAPGPAERRRILEVHLPDDHRVPALYLSEVAERLRLTGGQLRNAGQLATLLALDDDGGPVRRVHLESALRSEQEKAGATWPMEGPPKERGEEVEAFFAGLAR
ncbi:MAG: ATP-binding protein [Myxococcales bacterium]|nr:ATP-binding protein [Myxococcales bacterium]